MKLRTALFRMLALMGAAVFLLSAASCGWNEEQKRTEYRAAVVAGEKTAAQGTKIFTDAVRAFFSDMTDEGRGQVIAAIDGLSAAYTALRELEAPEDYEETQQAVRSGAELALQAVEVYRREFQEITREKLDDDFLKRMEAGDALLKQGQRNLMAAAVQCGAETESG